MRLYHYQAPVHWLYYALLAGLVLALGFPPRAISHGSSTPAVRCVHGVIERTPSNSLVQVTLRGLKLGTQYYVTVLVVLTDDRPGPETTLVVSTTSNFCVSFLCGQLKV